MGTPLAQEKIALVPCSPALVCTTAFESGFRIAVKGFWVQGHVEVSEDDQAKWDVNQRHAESLEGR